MEHDIVVTTLLLLTRFVRFSAAVSNSVQYMYTAVTPSENLPSFTAVSMVDGQQFEYYDSDTRKLIPKVNWMKTNEDYWSMNTQVLQGQQETFKVNIATLMQRFNQTQGLHTVQFMYGCRRDDPGTVTGYSQFGYDGEDFLILDLKTKTWTAANNKAVITKLKWESDFANVNYLKHFLENTCLLLLQKFVLYGKETLERKVPPKAEVFQKRFSSSPELVCHATGFFPKAVMMSWQKDGEEMEENVEVRETLPNQDGSFQKRIILRVSPEDLQKNNYTCVVQHSGLKEELRVELRAHAKQNSQKENSAMQMMDDNEWNKQLNGETNRKRSGLISTIVAGLCFFAICALWKIKSWYNQR